MSAAAALPTADTEPTDRRAGSEIPIRRVACPFFDRRGSTDREINRCGCGRWFAVVTGGDDGQD